MAIIDMVSWESDPETYAWKFPEDNLSTFTQLVVNESQEAVLFSKGKILGKFGAGKHTLDTENLPILRNLFGIPFGGKNPFTAQVWFVNKTISLDIKWGTPSPIQLKEPTYNVMIPVRAFGQFGIQIDDAEKFLVKLVGTLPSFGRDPLSSYFKGILIKHAADAIATTIVKKKISVLEIAADIVEMSEELKVALTPEFAEYGIRIVNFDIASINVPEDDPTVKKLREILAKKMEMDTLGFTYQQERSFDVMDKAASNEGGGSSGVMGAGIGMGMGVNMGNMMGGMMGGMVAPNMSGGQMQQQQTTKCPECGTPIAVSSRFCGGCGYAMQSAEAQDTGSQMIECDKCQAKFPSTAKFCGECGDPYNPCGKCGADNAEDATSCVKCNAMMPQRCKKCDTRVTAGAKFCPNCGESMVATCVKCKAALAPGAKFCPECGTNQAG